MKNINQKLFELQNEIGVISKDEKNPFYDSQYFDTNKLIKELKPLLKKYNLLLQQPIQENEVISKLICLDNGDSRHSSLRLPEVTIQEPQKIGSCITYYRRYTLQSLLALECEDDDGNKTVKNPPKKNPPKKKAPQGKIIKPQKINWTDKEIQSAVNKLIAREYQNIEELKTKVEVPSSIEEKILKNAELLKSNK